MSVINKVLRDLDQRQARAATQATAQGGTSAAKNHLGHGIAPLAVDGPILGLRRGHMLGLVGVLLVAVAVGWCLVFGVPRGMPGATAQPATNALVAAPTARQVPAPVPQAAVPTPTATAVPVPVQAAAVAASSTAPAAAPKALATPSVNAGPAPAAVASFKSTSVAAARLPVPAQATAVAPTAAMPPSAPATAPTTTATTTARMAADSLPPATQVIAQAQALWNEGAHASALDLLRQALSRVESPSAAPGSPALVALVRELARMSLAEGQVANTLSLLMRLEPQISQLPDLWAMRANAAQRLGQHTEAVSSYQRALALKAGEARWMQGQAVSLAAQGHLTEAGDLAERVRLQGALRPEIATYLRQLGVTVRAE